MVVASAIDRKPEKICSVPSLTGLIQCRLIRLVDARIARCVALLRVLAAETFAPR